MRTLLTGFLLFMLASVSALASSSDSRPPRYHLSVDKDLTVLSIRACFPDRVPEAIRAGSDAAAGLLIGARIAGRDRGELPPPVGRRMALPPLDAGACIEYDVDLRGSPRDEGYEHAYRGHDWVMVGIHLWLWSPVGDPGPLDLSMNPADGLGFSAPWSRRDDGLYHLGAERPRDWHGRVAIGRMARHQLNLPGGRLDVALLGSELAAHEALLMDWINANAIAVSTISGRFPAPHAQILVVPMGRSSAPVPWAQVLRGGGDGVHLFVDPGRDRGAFMRDWVLSHELSHLFHPTLFLRSRWLSEGLASYLQFVTRARSGIITQRQAWEGLHAGFERGIRDVRRGHTLADLSENMLSEQAYMRVYWSGAAVFLLADLELRRHSGGRQTLGDVLGRFRDCCLNHHEAWSGARFMSALDRVSGTDVFSSLFEKWSGSDRFPSLDTAYRYLGLRARNARSLILRDDPYSAILRGLIMSPRSQP
ncbi:MAG: hypothetical protein ACPGUC_03760 [Gammaproteobacteria bacterium]